MKYALVRDERLEAQPGLKALCICCNNAVIAKCGDLRIWHWSHKKKCDSWGEGETEWHRSWKNEFPKICQEVVLFDEKGEKHVADVKIEHGLVIEFQHSFIKQEEQRAREYFYKKMIWIVDGTRRLRDKNKFMNSKGSEPIESQNALYRIQDYFGECALLRDWAGCTNPVFFDFDEDKLWCLLPKFSKERYVFRIDRKSLVECLVANNFDLIFKNLIEFIKKYENLMLLQVQLKAVQRQNANYRPRISSRTRL